MTSFVISGVDGLCRINIRESDDHEADRELGEKLQANWSRCLSDAEADVSITVGLSSTAADDVVVASTIDALLPLSTQAITKKLIAQQMGRHLMLHAGCVVNEAGHAIALVAKGGTGKTTLTRGLGATYGYVTDETVSIRDDLTIAPYAKPLSIVTPGQQHKVETSPDELGLRHAGDTIRLEKVILLSRETDRGEATIEEMRLFDAIEGIVPQSSSIHKLDAPLQRLAHLAEVTGGFLHARYGEWESLLPALTEILGER